MWSHVHKTRPLLHSYACDFWWEEGVAPKGHSFVLEALSSESVEQTLRGSWGYHHLDIRCLGVVVLSGTSWHSVYWGLLVLCSKTDTSEMFQKTYWKWGEWKENKDRAVVGTRPAALKGSSVPRIPKTLLSSPGDQNGFPNSRRDFLFSVSFCHECTLEFSRGYTMRDFATDQMRKQIGKSGCFLWS